MGYPKYSRSLRPVCMRICRLKPLTLVKNKTDKKVINILVSELNPPICALIKEMAKGGNKDSVPITFASTDTLSRLCPPPPCDCEPCKELTPRERLIKRLILGSKIAFLTGSILLFWYIGGLGKTWETWNLKECVKNYYYACNKVQYVYPEKCEPPRFKGPLCKNTESLWNRTVIATVGYSEFGYYKMVEWFRQMLNYENCDYAQEKKKKPPPAAKKEKEKKPDYEKIYQSLFNNLDPMNIECSERPDYFARLFEMIRDESDVPNEPEDTSCD